MAGSTNTPEVTVLPGRLFVMGDNRDNSADSRVAVRRRRVGLLPIDNLDRPRRRRGRILGPRHRSQPRMDVAVRFRVARFFTGGTLRERPMVRSASSRVSNHEADSWPSFETLLRSPQDEGEKQTPWPSPLKRRRQFR